MLYDNSYKNKPHSLNENHCTESVIW